MLNLVNVLIMIIGNEYNFYLFFIYINVIYSNDIMFFWFLCEVIFIIFNVIIDIVLVVCIFFVNK